MPRECERSTSSSLSYPNVLTPKVFLKSASGEGPPSNRIIQRSREQIAPPQRSTWKHQFAPCLNYTVWFSHPGFTLPHFASSCFTSVECRSSSKSTCLRSLKWWAFLCMTVTYKWQSCRCDLPNTFPATSDNRVQPVFSFSLRSGCHTRLYATSSTCWLRPKLLKFLIRNNLWPMFLVTLFANEWVCLPGDHQAINQKCAHFHI